jgi:hypothetical protein
MEKLSAKQDEKVSRAEWIAISAFLLSVAGHVFSMGVVWRTVQEHERSIFKLEATTDALIPRVERIDANVQFLAEQARDQRIKELNK